MSIDKDLDELTDKVVAELKRLGPTAAAKKVGFSKGYIGRITTGCQRPAYKAVVTLAKGLGLLPKEEKKK